MYKLIRIATRGSKLALWQAGYVADLLTKEHPNLKVKLKVIKTSGDKITDVPLAKVGGKGLFVKEIEEAILRGEADLAVHSLKDVPAEIPSELKLGIFPERDEPSDCLISNTYSDLDSLPKNSLIGTSSVRRQAQLLNLRPDLNITSLRGNLDTRIKKLNQGMYDAIIVASVGMKRLGLKASYMCQLEPPKFLSAIGQGALGLEYAIEDKELENRLAFMDHFPTRVAIAAERSFLQRLEGGCQTPMGAYAILQGELVFLSGFVSDLQGKKCLFKSGQAKKEKAIQLGQDIADQILESGGREILQEVYAPGN